MHAWETIERSLDFIEEHLEEEIKIEALADTAALSPFYFQRLFAWYTSRFRSISSSVGWPERLTHCGILSEGSSMWP